jgi:hypothetical protein
MVFYSSRPIKTGDEICTIYHSLWADLSVSEESLQRAMLHTTLNLIFKWGIFCPPDCICNDANILLTIAEFSRLVRITYESGSEGDFKTSLMALKERLQLCNTHPRMIGNLETKIGTLYEAVAVATFLKDDNSAKETTVFIKELDEIMAQLEFPGSVKSLRYKKYTDDQESCQAIKRRFCELNATLS